MTDQPGPPQWGPPGQQPPPGGQYPPQGGPPAKPPKKRKKWPFIVGGILVLLVIGIANGSGGGKSTTAAATSTATAPTTTSAAPAPTTQQAAVPAPTTTLAPSTTTEAPAPTTQSPPKPSAETQYVTKQAHDAHVVVVSYQEVQAGVQVLSQGGGDASTAASFQQILSQAKSGFDSSELSFASFGLAVPKGLGDANDEASAAIREFSDAMSSARAYVDNRKPSDLASYSTHWNQGRKWWNEAVGKLWGAAHQPAPTV